MLKMCLTMSFRRQVWCAQNKISAEQLVVQELETDLAAMLKARKQLDRMVQCEQARDLLAGQGQHVFYGH